MSIDDKSKPYPKSMRHQQILDVAAQDPDASIEEIASRVPSASTDLVEQVLEEYGDPASDDTSKATGQPSTNSGTAQSDGGDGGVNPSEPHSTGTDSDGTEPNDDGSSNESAEGEYPSLTEITDKQRQVLAVVATEPDATQQEIGDRLDVSAATVSNRVNSIEGFDWSDRTSFVDAVFAEDPAADILMDGGSTTESTPSEEADAVNTESQPVTETDETDTMAEIETQLTRIEQRLTEIEANSAVSTGTNSVLGDPELVHKVVHACMESEAISESEALQILKDLLE